MNAVLTGLLGRTDVLLAGLVLSVLLLGWIARRVRRIAKSERPDDALSNVAMLIGLGWSSEAIWELTGRIPNFPAGVRVFLFFVLEILLIVSMIRAKRHVRLYGWPGKAGTTAWIIAASMGLVAAFVSGSIAEAMLRLAIPLLLTKQWWDGLVSGVVKRPTDASSWRWTPRRFLLWIGAIEPGERDVETVHRERLTQQMTRLEFARRHGRESARERRAEKLARLSLTADDDVIADVQRRVGRAMWFEAAPEAEPVAQPPAAVPASRAASVRAARVRHRRTIRTLRVTHPRPVIVAAQEPRQDLRATHEIDLVIRAIKSTDPKLPQRQIARLAATSEPTVRRALRRSKAEGPTQQINGNVPVLVGAGDTNEKEN